MLSMNQKYHNQTKIYETVNTKKCIQKPMYQTNALFGIQKSLSNNKIKVKSHYTEIHGLKNQRPGILLSRKHLNNLSLLCEYKIYLQETVSLGCEQLWHHQSIQRKPVHQDWRT